MEFTASAPAACLSASRISNDRKRSNREFLREGPGALRRRWSDAEKRPDPGFSTASDICDRVHLDLGGHHTGVHSRSHNLA